jgi:hypothetical protein
MESKLVHDDRLQRLLEAEAILTNINAEPRALFNPEEIEVARQVLFIVRRWVNDAIGGGR